MKSWTEIVGAYAISIFVAHYVVWYFLRCIRKTSGIELETNQMLVFVVGATERFMATTLVIFAPSYLAPFVGGWIALKYAANWQKNEKVRPREKSLLALVGTVWSFAIAIAMGCFICPDALNYFAKWKTHGH